MDEDELSAGNGRGDLGELDGDEEDVDAQEYGTMVVLERLESLEEEMQELGVTSLEDVRQRIAELHRQLDEL